MSVAPDSPKTDSAVPLLDIRQLAPLLSRSVSSLEWDQAAGRLPAPVRINGGSHKWRRADIEVWMAGGYRPVPRPAN